MRAYECRGHGPYSTRRELLDAVSLRGDAWITAPVLHGSVDHLLGACVEHGVEGIVAKQVDSRYVPGYRSPHWIKLKTTHWREQHPSLRHEHDTREASTAVS
jgi:bifunctional non-homologous end joining protein LigD